MQILAHLELHQNGFRWSWRSNGTQLAQGNLSLLLIHWSLWLKIQIRIPDYQESENEIIIDELEKKIEVVQLDMDSDN